MNPFKIALFLLIIASCSPQESTLGDENETEIKLNCDSTFQICLELVKGDSIAFTDDIMGGYYDWGFEYTRFTNDSFYRCKKDIISNFDSSLYVESIWEDFGLDTLFSKAEIEAYPNQDLLINPACYPEYNFISRDSMNKRYNHWENGADLPIKHFRFSKPLISADGNYIFMQMDDFRGPMNASGWAYLFKKQNERWTILRKICVSVA